MLSNLVSQLKEQHAADRYYEVLREIPKVREDLGEPPLVTPSSQIVGTQSVLNVLTGERYSAMSKETKALLKGEYGKTIKPFNPKVQKEALGEETPITCRPADLIPPELPELEAKVSRYKQRRKTSSPTHFSRMSQRSSFNIEKHSKQNRPEKGRFAKQSLPGIDSLLNSVQIVISGENLEKHDVGLRPAELLQKSEEGIQIRRCRCRDLEKH